MNNCEKKLDALIDALGFDVVETVSHNEYSNTLKGSLFCADITQKCVEEIIDYKLTKRDLFVPLPVNSDAWGCMVEYLRNHTADIESKTNDFNALAPMLDFINRNSNEEV